jgi:hypothetical protein
VTTPTDLDHEKSPEKNPDLVNAEPTKALFISMLVKDIPLSRAILDLVDNAVDGARRLRGATSYDGLSIDITVLPDVFRIVDNCGGIPIDVARDYAFRFGRPSGGPSLDYSVGQFGVGMKRALFKLGAHFVIESTAETSSFRLVIDVDEWKHSNDWSFEFNERAENLEPEDTQGKRGTSMEVTKLHELISAEFELENFRTRLFEEIQEAHQESISRNLTITLNEIHLHSLSLQLLASAHLQPAHVEHIFGETNEASVTVRIFAGVSESDPRRAGWYVFCNGRMILEANKTEVTGWGTGSEASMPRFHNQYARFRGYVFFESADAARLPWNTTKTGVDTDAALYRVVLQSMINIGKTVIQFLNELDNERTSEVQVLNQALTATHPVPLLEIARSDTFVTRVRPVRRDRRTGHVAYSKPVDQLEKAKVALQVTSYRDVGIKSFEYFYSREVDA